MFFRGRINWLIIAMCSLKAILIGAIGLNCRYREKVYLPEIPVDVTINKNYFIKIYNTK